MGFSRQEYWSGLPFPSPGDLPDPGVKPRSPALQADSLPIELRGKPTISTSITITVTTTASVMAGCRRQRLVCLTQCILLKLPHSILTRILEVGNTPILILQIR